MEAEQQVNDPSDPVPQSDSAAPKEEKTRRRSIRGRRSLIRVEVEGSSPVVIAAPLPDSIMENTAVDKVTQLTQRKNQILAYMEKLRAEKEEWEKMLERQSMKNKHAARNIDRCLERKPSARIRVEELGQMEITPKPRHVLNRVLRAFNKRYEDDEKRKNVERLQNDCEELTSSIETLKARAHALVALLDAEPKEELLARKKWLEDMKKKEERRMYWLKEKLDRMESREAFYNAMHGIESA